ncbi:hypothetical protein LTR17_011999 [Elasticomyces elasticus]|nr:hypothetical protein LTR17_011999 [Elasticomyces elasticus]
MHSLLHEVSSIDTFMCAIDLRKTFLCVRENHGGTYDMREKAWIGTYGCIFSVGVYFSVGKHKAFCAHIHPPCVGNGFSSIITEAKGTLLKVKTITKLVSHAKQNGWSIRDVNKSSVIMVCPLPDHKTNHEVGIHSKEHPHAKRPGFYVIEGIKEFLGLSSELEVDTASQGFVACQIKGEDSVKVPFWGATHDKIRTAREKALMNWIEAEAGGDRSWYCDDWDKEQEEGEQAAHIC